MLFLCIDSTSKLCFTFQSIFIHFYSPLVLLSDFSYLKTPHCISMKYRSTSSTVPIFYNLLSQYPPPYPVSFLATIWPNNIVNYHVIHIYFIFIPYFNHPFAPSLAYVSRRQT